MAGSNSTRHLTGVNMSAREMNHDRPVGRKTVRWIK
jgi:hypothetical protein